MIKKLSRIEKACLLILASLYLISKSDQHLIPIRDYKNHPCAVRKCTNDTKPMMCEYEWQIEWYTTMSKACLDCPYNVTSCGREHCISANGLNRPIIVVNRMLPGPAISVCYGDEVKIRLYNMLHMSEGTSIHWHGLTQRGTPYMDGVSMVTQCPINAHTFFDYRFTARNYGTHFWHAHSGLQRADGVFGPILVREPIENNPYADAYDFDLNEHVITVNEWTNETAIAKFAGHHHNDGDNKPSSILINGKGVLFRHVDANGRELETPRAEFRVAFGKSYRFRLINAGILYCPIEFSIDSHNLTIIASDGRYLDARQVESLIIYAGERYDFILNASQTPKNYWIRTRGLADGSVFRTTERAYLVYEEGLSADKSNLPDFNYETATRKGLQLNPWNTQINDTNRDKFVQIDEMRAILDKDVSNMYTKSLSNASKVKKFYLAMEFNKINNPEFQDERLYSLGMFENHNRTPLYTPQINNISMMMPSVPVLYEWDKVPQDSICNHVNRSHVCPDVTKYCACLYALEFDVGDVVEFVIVDEGFTFQSNHPMHLHGASFALLGVGKLNSSIKLDHVKELDKQGKLRRNFENPPLKDTVTVPVGGYSIIRFVADNPGTWMLHCHLDFHSEVGMGLLVKIGSNNDLPKPPSNWPACGNFEIKTSHLNTGLKSSAAKKGATTCFLFTFASSSSRSCFLAFLLLDFSIFKLFLF